MDNVFAQIKTTELKGSTFRSRILDFGDFDISDAEFKIVFKKSGNVLPFTDFAPQKVGNTLIIPYNILESYIGEIRMEAWMSLNGITDLAMVDTMLISAENQLKSDATNQNISVTFGDVVIPLTFTQAIVNIGGGNGIATWDLIQNKPTQFPPENHTHSYNDLNDKPTIPQPVDISGKQDFLVSGTNIKTVNGQSILGAGDIQIEGSGGGTAPATIFDMQNNTESASMKATADYLLGDSEINNIINLSIVNNYLNSVGDSVSSANWRASGFIDVEHGQQYIYYGRTNSGGAANAIIGYNSNNTFNQVILGANAHYPFGYYFTIPEGVAKIKICTFSDIVLKLILRSPVKKIKSTLLSEQSPKDINKSWGAIGHSVWASDGVLLGIQTLVQNKFKFTEYEKYAYSGASLTGGDVNSILFASRISQWTAKDIFTYDSITNDFKMNRPIGTQDDFINNTGNSTYYGSLRSLHEKLKSLNPYYLMICANALKRNNGGYTSWSLNTAGHTLTDYSNALEWVSNRLSWRFINQFRDSGINDDNVSIFTSDGLHPTNTGYKRYADLWINQFEIIYRGT